MARKSQFSIATISRVMNPSMRHKVAPKTLNSVDALIKKHGYTPSLAARHLGGASFKTIGVVLPHFPGIFFSDYYTQILSGVADALIKSDYNFKLIMLKSREAKWDKYDFKAGDGVDGLIVTHWSNFFSECSVLEKFKIPCLVLNDPGRSAAVHFAASDNSMGGELAAKYLYAKGHRKIAILAGPSWSSDSHLRIQGFKRFFNKKRIPFSSPILHGDFQEEKAAELTELFLKKNSNITAFFCCNDLMACGVLKKLQELGIKCPKDISVMGYDDDRRAELSNPPLTTIHVPLYELAKAGTNSLLLHLKQEKTEFFQSFPVHLVERKSVGNINLKGRVKCTRTIK